MMLVKEMAVVAAGGATGATLRYLSGIAILKLFGPQFPAAGTLFVNVVGSFAMGVFIELLVFKLNGSHDLRLFVATGLLGGFTTFSAFSLDFAVLYERGALAMAAGYLVASVSLSILGLFAGLYVARSVFAA